MSTCTITTRSQIERKKQTAFDWPVSILAKQGAFTCCKRNPKRGSRSVDLPRALYADVQPKWNCYEFGAQSTQFSREFYCLTKDLGGSVITIEMDKNCEPHIKMDYSEFLIDRTDLHFASHPPHVMVFATNCPSNSPLSVTHYRRHFFKIDHLLRGAETP